MQGWTSHIPIYDPISTHPKPSFTLSSIPRRGDTLPAPLPTPSSTSPRPPTPNQEIGSTDGGPNVLSPPTPAPSPRPRESFKKSDQEGVDLDQVESTDDGLDLDIEEDSSLLAKGRSKHTDPDDLIRQFKSLPTKARHFFLSSLLAELSMAEALSVTRRIEPRLRRDFLGQLPTELALHCLSFVDDARTLARASQVSRYWNSLLMDENTWKEMCDKHRFTAIRSPLTHPRLHSQPGLTPVRRTSAANVPTGGLDMNGRRKGGKGVEKETPLPKIPDPKPSFRQHFKTSYQTESNWLQGGRVLAAHTSQTDAVVTSLAIDDNYLVIGMADGPIHVFDSHTGASKRTLAGHHNGVWTLALISAAPPSDPKGPPNGREGRSFHARAAKNRTGGYKEASAGRRFSFNNLEAFTSSYANSIPGSFGIKIPRPSTVLGFAGEEESNTSEGSSKDQRSDPCNSARGWGNRRPLVVSGGCDRQLRVWDLISGQCILTLRGHTSTVRCVKVLDGRPIVVSGSRDGTLKVWDISKGELLRTLNGHEQSVRCIEVAGNKVVSGSYDFTCRLWDIDTGECLHVLRGHYHQIYCVAFDGRRVISGSLDSSVRVWDAETGECTSMLQGHTSLVGQLQLSGDILVTGGSDGRVITFDLKDGSCIHRLCAHDNSVTTLQFDDRFIISGGNDGRVKLWDFRTGAFVRELSKPGEAVWRVAFKDDQCAVLLQRATKTILEVITFKPLGQM